MILGLNATAVVFFAVTMGIPLCCVVYALWDAWRARVRARRPRRRHQRARGTYIMDDPDSRRRRDVSQDLPYDYERLQVGDAFRFRDRL